MQVGDYIRTKNGIIAKCIKEDINKYIFDKIIIEEGYYHDYEYKDINFKISCIKKYSSNIINLIEIGDIVINQIGEVIIINSNNIDELKDYWSIYKNSIKSIITHEQYDAIKYEL